MIWFFFFDRYINILEDLGILGFFFNLIVSLGVEGGRRLILGYKIN